MSDDEGEPVRSYRVTLPSYAEARRIRGLEPHAPDHPVDEAPIRTILHGAFGPPCVQCGGVSEALCDFPIGAEGRTCDRALCLECAPTTGRDENHCREHAEHGPGMLLFPPRPAPPPPAPRRRAAAPQEAVGAEPLARPAGRRRCGPHRLEARARRPQVRRARWWHRGDVGRVRAAAPRAPPAGPAAAPVTHGDRVRLISRWGDVPIDAIGAVVRSYSDPGGRRWVRVEWCRTLDGRPVRLTYPAGVLEVVDGTCG